MTTTLITGADGHVGRALARRLLRNDDARLLLFVRAADQEEREAKIGKLGSLASHPRCRMHFGDLRAAQPFDGIAAGDIDGILHCAAVIDFNVDRETAAAVNIEGTRKTLDFAERCARLRRFGLLSSIYTTGLRTGEVRERAFDPAPEYANHYEWSKWRAEREVLERTSLPWQIYRLSTIVCDDARGRVSQQNALHNTLRLLYYGLLTVLPGERDTRVYTVTTDFASRAIASLFAGGDDRAVYHLTDAGSDALTVGELTDIAYAAFLDDPDFAKQHILPPVFCDRDSFDALVDSATHFGGAVSQSLQSVAPFAAQLFCDKDVHTDGTRRALNGLRAHDSRQLFDSVARHLVQTRWGLRPAAEKARV